VPIEPEKRGLIGTIELIATIVVVVAVVVLAAWFLLFAHDPLLHP
jgi:hypothetical protein